MKITEINDIILGNVELDKPSRFVEFKDYSGYIKEIIPTCVGLFNCGHLTKTRTHTEFYEANPLLDCFISDYYKENDVKQFKKELFYAMLCGAYVPKVPGELTALFVMTRREVESPNKMIAALDKSRMKKYLTVAFSNNKYIMKELLDLVWGFDVQLVTNVRPSVTNRGIVEIYIDNINDILLCNEGIKDILTDVRDFNDLWYSKEKGIVIGEKEVPLRTLIHSYGITEDDLDLRKVFSSI